VNGRSVEPIASDEPIAVVVERVRPNIRAAPGRPPERPSGEDPDGPPSRDRVDRALSYGDLTPVLAVVAIALLSGDLPVSLLAGGAAVLAVALHRAATSGRFGFGDGFLAFRSDQSWPHGVQEDDDFQWSWTRGDEPRSATTRRTAVR
jgi:hypothetical protein